MPSRSFSRVIYQPRTELIAQQIEESECDVGVASLFRHDLGWLQVCFMRQEAVEDWRASRGVWLFGGAEADVGACASGLPARLTCAAETARTTFSRYCGSRRSADNSRLASVRRSRNPAHASPSSPRKSLLQMSDSRGSVTYVSGSYRVGSRHSRPWARVGRLLRWTSGWCGEEIATSRSRLRCWCVRLCGVVLI